MGTRVLLEEGELTGRGKTSGGQNKEWWWGSTALGDEEDQSNKREARCANASQSVGDSLSGEKRRGVKTNGSELIRLRITKFLWSVRGESGRRRRGGALLTS